MPCNSPITVKCGESDIQVPCRRCLGCRIDRRRMFSMRMRFEMYDNYKKGYGSSFLTLTYNPDNYKGGLVKKDLVDFNKRLRYYLRKENPIGVNPNYKYFAVGELGELGERGHYHILYIGIDTAFMNKYARKAWTFGFITCDVATVGRINYVLKYMDKQNYDFNNLCTDKTDVHYGLFFDKKTNTWQQPPFSMISKGLGSDYLKRESVKALETGTLSSNGKYVKFPMYYAKKFGVDTEVLKKRCLDALDDNAKKNGLSRAQFTLRKALQNETVAVSKARLGGEAVDTTGLNVASSSLNSLENRGKSSELVEKIIMEI